MWTNSTTCTSPVVAGGLLYVYNPNGSLNVYDPLRGMRVANLNMARATGTVPSWWTAKSHFPRATQTSTPLPQAC